MSLGPIGVSSASASSSLSSSNQSIAFNPVITLASPESQIRQETKSDQGAKFDQSGSATARSEASPSGGFGLGGADGSGGGYSGLDPLLSLGSSLVPRVAGGRGAVSPIESLDYASGLGSEKVGSIFTPSTLGLVALAAGSAALLFKYWKG